MNGKGPAATEKKQYGPAKNKRNERKIEKKG
jgi:hypothetical protein